MVFFFQAEDGIRDVAVTGVQTCALPISQTVSLSAAPRQATGKGAARQARFHGKVPAVIYGRGRNAQPLELEANAVEKALQGVEPAITIIELSVDRQTVKTLFTDIQRHPIRPHIIH